VYFLLTYLLTIEWDVKPLHYYYYMSYTCIILVSGLQLRTQTTIIENAYA